MKKFLHVIIILPFAIQPSYAGNGDERLNHSHYHLNQFSALNWNAQEYASQISLFGNYRFNSTMVPHGFTNAILLEKRFKGVFQTNALDKTGKKNFFETDLETGLLYARQAENFPLLGEAKYYAGIKNRYHIHLKASEDAFRLFMKGNAQFENQTAALSSSEFKQLVYHQVIFGFNKTTGSGSSQFEIGAGLSAIFGATDLTISIREGALFTAEDGEYLDLSYDVRYSQANTGVPGMFEFNGAGFSADLNFSIIQEGNYQLNFQASDLGFVRFFNQTLFFDGDSSFRFEGIVIDDIFSIDDTTVSDKVDEYIDDFIPQRHAKNYNVVLPAIFHAAFTKITGEKTALTIGGRYRLMPGYIPHVFLKGNYFIQSDFVASLIAGYGGYGTYNIGVELVKRFDRYYFSAGSQALQGFFAPEKATGSSLYFCLGVSF